ncbi:MAG: hypothetical protein HFH34_02480 [Eubacterium sp.]|jgi:hypothetical protein|nr:hypothetical protein [Eubacterium sp.]
MAKSGKTTLRALPAQSTEELSGLNQKIRIHRIKILILILMLTGAAIGLLFAVLIYFETKVYTDYEVIEQIERRETSAAAYEEFQGNVLQYTQDGAVYSSISGEVFWNQPYEMESPRIAVCEDYLAIYEQGGNRIYIMNTVGQQGTIQTTIPVQRVSIARQGKVAVLMEDSQTSYIHMYDKDGKQLSGGELHIENSGYPLDLALSRDALKLAVSMLDIQEADVKSTVVFYNYGTVGQNEIDNIVGSYSYKDMIIPSIRFVTNDRLIAFGDEKVLLFEGKQKPAVMKEIKCGKNIRSIYYDEDYFGLVFDDAESAKGYVTKIYNMKGRQILEQKFDLDYTAIDFLQNGLLCIRNEKSVQLFTMRGSKRFEYTFDRSIYDVISGSGQLDYWLILNGETDRIKLKDKL